MISKVPGPHSSGPGKQLYILGASIGGRRIWVSQPDIFFLFSFKAACSNSSYNMGIPGFTPSKIPQDFAHLRAPHPLPHFYP